MLIYNVLCRLFWLVLVIVAFCSTVLLSLQSLNRYETKSTVVSIEKDHYYWNTTLPSFTLCPIKNRIDKNLFEEYCAEHGINGITKVEFQEFIETLANSTYDNFESFKEYKLVDVKTHLNFELRIILNKKN